MSGSATPGGHGSPIRRTRGWAALLGASTILLGGCVSARPPGQVAAIPPVAQWQRTGAPGSGFSIAMPGRPALSTGVDRDFDGTPIRRTAGKLVAAQAVLFGYIVFDAPGGFVHDPYAEAREAAAGGEGGTESNEVVRFEKEYEAHGFFITDRIVDMRDDELVMYMRIYVGKTRAYGAFVAAKAASEPHLRPLVDGYFGSVQLDPAQAITPMGDGVLRLDRWEFIYPPEADFAVRMPGSAHGVEGEDSFAGRDVLVRRYGVQNGPGNEVFEVVVTNFDDELPGGVLAKARQGWIEHGYRVVLEGFTEARGYGGRTVRYDNGTEVVQVSYFETASRLYELRVRAPRARQADLAQARRWFADSFRIF